MKLHIAIIALIAVLCTGCKEENNHHPIVTSHHNVMYIGDQMCWAYSPDGIPLIDQSAPTLLKLSSTCSMEAKIQYATRIPTKGYDTVVIALGANNIPDQDVSTFKNTYQEAIDNILATSGIANNPKHDISKSNGICFFSTCQSIDQA